MKTVLEFQFNMKGMNSSGGLIRGHWSKMKKEKDKILWAIIGQTKNRHKGQVKITYTRWSPKMMDWDNLSSTQKNFLDSLAKAKVIKNDSPETIPIPPLLRQEKGKAKTQIIIEDLIG